MPRAAKIGVYDRETVPATQAFKEGMWERTGLKRRNEEEKSHMLGEGSPQEREPVVYIGGV